MGKYRLLFLALVTLAGCNQNDSAKTTTSPADSSQQPGTIRKDTSQAGKEVKPEHSAARDTLLLKISTQVLTAIKNKDFNTLASYVHPGLGVRFSPYAYIDTVNNKIFTRSQLIEYGPRPVKFTWGTTDGEGKAIIQNISGYFDRYVYDKDFLNAKEKTVNKFLGTGNSLNNLEQIYTGTDFTEFYFPGFDPKYEGMDWRTLRLVFKTENNHPWLIAIVHDEWTI